MGRGSRDTGMGIPAPSLPLPTRPLIRGLMWCVDVPLYTYPLHTHPLYTPLYVWSSMLIALLFDSFINSLALFINCNSSDDRRLSDSSSHEHPGGGPLGPLPRTAGEASEHRVKSGTRRITRTATL